MADFDITFDADATPLQNVIGRLSKEMIDFAKKSQSTFSGVSGSINTATQSAIAYNKQLAAQEAQLKKIGAASSIKTPGTSATGLSQDEIRAIQAGLADSTTQARQLSNELSKMSRSSISDENVRAIQAGLAQSTTQARELANSLTGASAAEQSSVEFLRQQVSQYDLAIQKQNEINGILDKRLSKSKEIELAAKPQNAGAPSDIGLTPEQIRQVQAALAESTEEAKRLRDEFLKQNKDLGKSTDLVKVTGKELTKAYSKDLVRVGKELVLYTGQTGEKISEAANRARNFGTFVNRIKSTTSALSKLWGDIGDNGLPALRYALYDVSNTARRISIAAAALGTAPIAFSVQYEREFANVIRTNELVGDSMEDARKKLKAELLQIAQTTPISWADVTNIATLAGQLGVAESVIGRFTESVAKFAATTDLTVDAAATAFGRLDQLIDGVDGKFENLGSAILAVGVDSVATESQIVNVSTQIASMGNLAGLTAPEIIGLSGAIASLGIRPELARGNITRLFSNIGKSAAEGGFNVGEFGRLTGRTADQFVADWGTRPGDVLQDFFDGINAEGPEAERTLRQLGITSVRDIPAILRLAQNSDEVRRLIELSSKEYLYATKITEQYGVISNTTAEQIKRLGQNFTTLQASIGDSVGPLAGLFGVLNSVVEGFTAVSNTPIGVFLNAVFISVSLLIAALFGMISVFASSAAGMLALRFAASKLGIELNGTLVKALFGSSAAMSSVAASSGRAAVGVRVLSLAMRSMLISTGIGIALVALTSIVGHFAMQSKNAAEDVERFFGSAESLAEAIDKDTAAFDENTGKMRDGSAAIRTFEKDMRNSVDAVVDQVEVAGAYLKAQDAANAATEDSSGALDESAQRAEAAAAAQRELAAATDEASDAATSQTMAVGANTLDFFKEGLLQQGELVNLFGTQELSQIFTDAGGDLNELLVAGIDGNSQEVIDAIVSNVKAAVGPIRDEYLALSQQPITSQEQVDRLRELDEQMKQYQTVLDTVEGELTDYAAATGTAIDQQETFQNAVVGVDEALDSTAERLNIASEEIKIINDAMFANANYTKSAEDALAKYAAALATTGDEANLAAGEIQGVITSILAEPSGDTNIILGNLGGLLLLLEAQGPQTAAAQALVRTAIDEVGQSANLQTPNVIGYAKSLNATANFDAANFQQLMADALDGVGSSATGASEKVKTLNEQFAELVDSIFEPVNAARSAAQSIADLGEAYAELGEDAFYASDEIQDAVSSILETSSSPEEAVANLNALYSQLAQTVGSDTAPSLQFLGNTINQVAQQFGVARDAVDGFATVDLDFFNRGVKAAQEEVRTLLDYASDLEAVFSRAFDIRFASTFAIDNIAEAWFDLGSNVEDARYQVEELIATQSDLGSDRALKEYFLSVAEAYNDTLRASQLRKEIAELDREQAQNARDLAEAQQIAGGDLVTQGPGSRQNRAALLGLVQEYQSYITTLAESGATQEELKKATEEARREFTQQAKELGFQEDVVLEYAAAFDDVQTAISNVERNITVDANVDPALQALNELNAKLNDSIDLAKELNRVQGQPTPAPAPAPGPATQPAYTQPGFTPIPLRPPGTPSPTPVGDVIFGSARTVAIDARQVQFDREFQSQVPIFADGGFTGRGGRMDPAGIVHKGEYVVPKQYVNQSTGMPDPSFLAQLQNGMRGYQMGGFVGGGGMAPGDAMMVELSPYDRKLLENAGNVQLRLNGKVVAEATNQSNFNQARRGSD